MKKTLIFLVLAALVFCTGCDAFRKLAGRPVSEDIEAKRTEIERIKEAEHARIMDSLARVERAVADSLAIVDSIEREKEKSVLAQLSGSYSALKPAALGGLSETQLESRYYIIVGAFSNKSNAEKMLGQVEEAGYPAAIISFKNGYNAVGVCPAEKLDEVLESFEKLRSEKFCPDDAWILVGE